MKTNLQLPAAGIAVAAMLLFAGCAAQPTIGFEANREANLSGVRTYALLPLPQKIEGADPGAALRVNGPLTQEIRTGMNAKGYTESTPQQADIVLNVRGNVVGKTDITDYGYSYAGYRGWGGYYDAYGGISVDQYNEGTLTIEAFNRQTKQLVWVGWARGRMPDTPDEARFRATISEIVAKFPPTQTAPAMNTAPKK